MRRIDLEHIIRAAGSIANAPEPIIIGSQSLLATFPDPPAELTVSEEADTYPADAPERADIIDGSIGEKSPFHETFGYYAHGVGPETAVLPQHWRTRLVRLQNENTRGYAGLCLSPSDLAVSKLAAGREKDLDFVTALFRHRLLRPERVEALLVEVPPETAELVGTRLATCRRRAETA